MSALTLFLIAIAIAGLLSVAGIIAVAMRRGPDAGPFEAAELDRRARRADRSATVVTEAGGTVATVTEAPPEEPETAPPADPALEVAAAVPAAEFGITRRKFFTRALLVVWALFLAQFGLASLAFLWPKLKGGFGTKINVGKYADLKAEVLQGGTVVPKFIAAAQTWIIPFELKTLEDVPGNSYENLPFVIAGGEDDGVALMALWQRCPHLGCRVPSCVPSQGFECPCHGSKYNIHGEYEAGPAPRNMDRFEVTINDNGDLIVNTGNIVQTPRSKNKTAKYPQGPFCV